MIYSPHSLVRAVLAGVVMQVSVLCPHVQAADIEVALVLSEQGGAYQEFRNALVSSLAENDINVSVIDPDNALPKVDLVITAGMKAAVAVAGAKPAAMLAVLIPKDGTGKLIQDFPALVKPGQNMLSAIYLDQPLRRQLNLITALLPEAQTVGILYSAPPKELNTLRSLAASRKLELKERTSESFATLHNSLQSLLQESDVLLALPDAEIYNQITIRNILLATYRNKVPLVGFSPAYVKAGALCAVFSTPEQIAVQSLNIIREFVETGVLPAPQYAKEFEVSVNEQVARSLGLNIKSASRLRSEIGVAQ